MVPDEVTLEDALRLLTLPRTLGADPVNGEEIVADNGRYGPYVRKGTDYRSLESEDQLFTVTPRRGGRPAVQTEGAPCSPGRGSIGRARQ